LPKDTANKLAGLSSHYPFNAKHQPGKLQISTFKVFCSDSTRYWTHAYQLWGGCS